MAQDIERITAPGKYAIDRSFEEINYQLQQFEYVNRESVIQQVKENNKTKYNGKLTNK